MLLQMLDASAVLHDFGPLGFAIVDVHFQIGVAGRVDDLEGGSFVSDGA